MIIGVDPGLKGGVCVGGISFPMPVDEFNKICPIILANKIRTCELLIGDKGGSVYVERVGARPGQGVTSMFNFGYGCGTIYGVLATLGYKVFFVTPQKWKKAVLGGNYPHDKEGTIAFCRAEYPGIELVQPRCRTPHDGVADSVAIWHYGELENK